MKRKRLEEIEEIKEEADYVNAVHTVEEVAAPPDRRFVFFTQTVAPIAVCWLILFVIMGLRIHCTTVISEKNAVLTAENLQLSSRNQELETQRDNLTEQIRDIKTETNISQAQWIIDAYCPRVNDSRQCNPCPEGWVLKANNCYVYNDVESPNWKTWEEAREDCRGKNSHLAVVRTDAEKDAVNEYSPGGPKNNGYWIGLRAEDGVWKWVDGSNVTVTNWGQQPDPDPLGDVCAGSIPGNGWFSVPCDGRTRWMCQQRALSV